MSLFLVGIAAAEIVDHENGELPGGIFFLQLEIFLLPVVASVILDFSLPVSLVCVVVGYIEIRGIVRWPLELGFPMSCRLNKASQKRL